MAAKFENRRPRAAHLSFCNVDELGATTNFLLQRRIRANVTGQEAPLGIGETFAASLGGNLERYWASNSEGSRQWRSNLGRGPASIPGTKRLPRRNVPHVFVQPL